MGQSNSIQLTTREAPTPANDPATVPTGAVETPNGVQFQPKGEEPKTPETPKIETPERPAWLPEKYKTPEEFAKAHAALEAKLGQPKTPVAKTATPKEGEAVNLEAVATEFATQGAISEESYEALEKQGIPRKMVSAFLAGQQAIAEKNTADLASVVGSKETLTSILQWAGTALTPEEIAGYNAMIDQGNIVAAKVMLSAFQSKYTDAVGQDPKLVTADPAKPTSEGGYNSTAEMTADMRDRRYQTDPAFRAKVARRVGLTTAF